MIAMNDRRRANALDHANSNRRQSTGLAFLWEWFRSVVIALALFFVIRSFFVEAFKIPTGSMEGTLLVGDFLLVNKLVYGAEVPFTKVKLPAIRTPARGDIIVFQWPLDRTKNFVKRIVGLPGDTLEMRQGQLILNGRVQREEYASHTAPGSDVSSDEEFKWQLAYLLGSSSPVRDAPRSPVQVQSLQASPGYHPSRNNWGPLIVPQANYFVLGDNRDNSLDSRYWGFVADSLVRGQPLVVYYSYNPDGGVKLDWLTRVRWKRFGEMIQ
ncbi:MAG TPA: signal peptidase I [Gemmatimonadaceae bacterium]|nr:signal peptidase I [Gemmatimonadaceae bacterium]